MGGWGQLGREGEKGRERERKREKGRPRQSFSGLQLVTHIRTNTQPVLSSAHSSGEGVCRFDCFQSNAQDMGRCPWFGMLFTSKHSNTHPCYRRGLATQLAQPALQQQPARVTCTICQCCCPPLAPFPHPTGGETPKLFLPAATANNFDREVIFPPML